MTDSLANLDMTACYLVPSSPNFSQNIGSWRQKKYQAPPIPPRENNCMIPKFFENGKKKKKKFNRVWLKLPHRKICKLICYRFLL